MSKKDRSKKKSDKVIKPIEQRTKEERQEEAKKIIGSLNDLRLSIDYDEVKELFGILQKYIQTGERIEVNIPFPAIGRRITGVLAINKTEQVVIRLTKN